MNKFGTLIACLSLALLSTMSVAQQASEGGQIDQIALGLVDRLPLDKKIVLKALSPEETGLPEDFLRKLSSDLEAALLVASDFEIKLTNRLTTEDLWAEAVEFGDANFEELYASSQAELVLMVAARATSAGVEISVTAYRLLGEDAGQVVASSGSVLLAMDIQKSLGVDINDLNSQMVQVLKEIEEFGRAGGIIADADSYSQYYHNARVFQQRGEADLAMQNLEQALSQGYPFVDPLLDLLDLANARYGQKASKAYVEKRVVPLLDENLLQVINVVALEGDDWAAIDAINSGEINFPPALAMWLKGSAKRLKQMRDGKIGFEAKTKIDAALLAAVRRVSNALRDNVFPDFFIDDIRSLQYAEKYEAEALEQELNRAYVHRVNYVHVYKSIPKTNISPLICTWKADQDLLTLTLEGQPSGYTQKPLPTAVSADTLRTEKEVSCLGVDPTSYTLAVSGKNVSSFSASDFMYDFEGFSGAPCRLVAEVSIQHNLLFPASDASLTRSGVLVDELVFSTPELMPIGGLMSDGDFGLFADACIEAKSSDGMFEGGSTAVPPGKYVIPYLGGLVITDSVDITVPIKVYFREVFGDGAIEPSDITRDGTYISPWGPTIGGGNGEYGYAYLRPAAEWLFAPGLIQSSPFEKDIAKIVYSRPSGEIVELTNVDYIDIAAGTFVPDQTQYDPIIADLEVPTNWWEMDDFVKQQVNSYKGSSVVGPSVDLAMIERLFRTTEIANRRYLQESLQTLGFYQGQVDGLWGPSILSAFTQLFSLLDQYYPDRQYVKNFGLDKNGLLWKEFVIFWNAMYGCEEGQLLSITAACRRN